MDTLLQLIFESEIETQCRFMLLADDRLQTARGHDHDAVWSALHGILIAAANVSKLAWGGGGDSARKRRFTERADLRAMLGLADDSPLRSPVLRDDFEHIDSRLELWRPAFQGGLAIRSILRGGGPSQVVRKMDPFGQYHADTGLLFFWAPGGQPPHSLSVPELVAEARQVIETIQAARPNQVRSAKPGS